jgi:FAD/FMN-containing dehydrogenase
MSATTSLESWGRYPRAEQKALPLFWSTETPPFHSLRGTVLPYGRGRSYGDVCLNDGGTLLTTARMDHFLAFDSDTGRLHCEAGVCLDQILDLIVPRGWFLPVTPGTKFITVAGAVANDIHGKNHHRMGTFGEHVCAFELLRSDGSRRVCSITQNPELFRVTIGGLGLTGLILSVEFQLKRIQTPFIMVENIKYRRLADFFALVQESEAAFEHTVAWVDCLASGKNLGRGIFMRGNTATPAEAGATRGSGSKRQLAFPFDAPNWLLNRLTVTSFNTLFYHKQLRERETRLVHYNPFFYPLDAILDWNRMYGRRGFFQYQFVAPMAAGESVVSRVLEKVSKSGAASFLAVIKTFGHRPQAGMLSFPRPGVTLAMDLANQGGRTLRLLDELDEIVLGNGGVLYPAKDARMSPQSFEASYPNWKEFAKFIDPQFSSSFWRRVTRSS